MNRADRRHALKSLPSRVRQHPVARRILANYRRHGPAALQLYTLQGETSASRLYFEVFSLCSWSQANAGLYDLHYDWPLARHLVESGAVERDHLLNVTIHQGFEPVIMGRSVVSLGDLQILDGAHRYVAAGMAMQMMGANPADFTIPAYALDPDDWRRFIIPPYIVEALQMA